MILTDSHTRQKSRTLKVLAASLALIMAGWLAGPALAQDEPDDVPPPPRAEPVKHLRIMLLDLSDLREPENTQPGFENPKSSFRHTFGSQRRTSEATETTITLNPERLEADVVLLREVDNVRFARRLFPATDWRLVLARENPKDRQLTRTAIALWLQSGVRFGGVDPALAPGSGATMRIVSGLGTLWILSPTEHCKGRDSSPARLPCPAIEDWLTSKPGSGELALVGGYLPVSTGASPSKSAPRALPVKAAPEGASELEPRMHDGVVELTAADAAGRCGGDDAARPALNLRIGVGGKPAPKVAGYVLPLELPPKPADTANAPPPRAPACALLLDLEAAQ